MKNGMLSIVARVGAVMVLVALVVAGFVAYDYLKPTAAASGPIEAIAIQPTQSTDGAEEAVVYTIDQAVSEARYVVDEVLRGEPFTVVGETDQVAGQLAVDLGDFDAAQLGVIQINARALATDSSQRDRAVQNQVLLTNEHEYITFAPTALVGLPAELAVGETAAFQVVAPSTDFDLRFFLLTHKLGCVVEQVLHDLHQPRPVAVDCRQARLDLNGNSALHGVACHQIGRFTGHFLERSQARFILDPSDA